MVSLMFIGMIFETFIIAIALLLLILILKKYFIKKHKFTLYLFIIFLNLTLAIVFSWLSKVLGVYSDILGLNYLTDVELPAPNTIDTWFILRITEFRISFVFLAIGMFYSYILKVKLFEKGYNSRNRILIFLYFIFVGVFSLVVYFRGNFLIDVFAFLFTFLLVFIIYLPLTYKTYQGFRTTDVAAYKKGFLSLSIMGICFIFILLNFLFDRILILLGDPGFTIFYFLAWIFAILGILSAYLGYIRPRGSE